MDVLLIAGFLGAGKTTLIRHLLGSSQGRGKKLAILVNEVGKMGSVIVNYSGGTHRIEPVRNSHPTALVLVGRKCPKDEILEALKKCVMRESGLEQIPA